MLDINLIRKQPNRVKQGIAKKNVNPQIVDDFLVLDKKWKETSLKLDNLRAEHNELSGDLAKNRTEEKLQKAKNIKEETAVLEKAKQELEQQRDEALELIPNVPFDDVPVGKDETENKTIYEKGKKPEFDFEPADYIKIGEKLGIIDVKKSAEVAGSRFGYLLGDTVMLEFALVRFVFNTLIQEGFKPVIPPVMVKPKVYSGMGRLAGSQKEERYYLEKDNLYLVGSSEHTIGPFHLNDILEEKTLPRRYVAFSTCFRREAGSHGKDTKGILRVHQFDKVEMFSFTAQENSEEEHKYLLSLQEKFMAMLGLPYRVVEICTGDMGWTDARQYDIETWLPGQPNENGKDLGRYRETHSCSNTTDFQARGINARYRGKDGKIRYLHMLNATGLAIGRTIIAIIENYQTKEGLVRVPEILQPFLDKKIIS